MVEAVGNTTTQQPAEVTAAAEESKGVEETKATDPVAEETGRPYEEYALGNDPSIPWELRLIDLDKLKREDKPAYDKYIAHRKRKDKLLEPLRADSLKWESEFTDEERQVADEWETKMMTPADDEVSGA